MAAAISAEMKALKIVAGVTAVKTGVQESVNQLLRLSYDMLGIFQESKFASHLDAERMATYCRKKVEANIEALISIAVRTDSTTPFYVDLKEIPSPPPPPPPPHFVTAVDGDADVPPGSGLEDFEIGIGLKWSTMATGIGAAAKAVSSVATAEKDIKSLVRSNSAKAEFDHPLDQPAKFLSAAMIVADLLRLEEMLAIFVIDGKLPGSIKAYFE